MAHDAYFFFFGIEHIEYTIQVWFGLLMAFQHIHAWTSYSEYQNVWRENWNELSYRLSTTYTTIL